MEPENKALLREGAAGLGIPLGEAGIDTLDRYLALLDKWSARLNLTAVKGERERVVKLLLDSLAVVPVMERELGAGRALRVMDLGSGAGLPGVPMKAARPEWEVVLCESRGKKAVFLRTVVVELGLKGVEVFNGRAEDYERNARRDARVMAPAPRCDGGGGWRFDAVVCRAVGEIRELARVGGPLLRAGGLLLCMKGPDPAAEVKSEEREIAKAGLKWRREHYYELPDEGGGRSIVVLEREVGK